VGPSHEPSSPAARPRRARTTVAGSIAGRCAPLWRVVGGAVGWLERGWPCRAYAASWPVSCRSSLLATPRKGSTSHAPLRTVTARTSMADQSREWTARFERPTVSAPCRTNPQTCPSHYERRSRRALWLLGQPACSKYWAPLVQFHPARGGLFGATRLARW
jgi:hypothetical protein